MATIPTMASASMLDMLDTEVAEYGAQPSFLGAPVELATMRAPMRASKSGDPVAGAVSAYQPGFGIGDRSLENVGREAWGRNSWITPEYVQRMAAARPDLFKGVENPAALVQQAYIEGESSPVQQGYNLDPQLQQILSGMSLQRRGVEGMNKYRTNALYDDQGQLVYADTPYRYDPAGETWKSVGEAAALAGAAFGGLALAGAGPLAAAGGAGTGAGSSMYSLSSGATGGGAGLSLGGAAPTLTATGSGLATSAQAAAAAAAGASPYSLAGMGLTSTGAGLSAAAQQAAADILAGSVGQSIAGSSAGVLTPAQQAAAGMGGLPPIQPVAAQTIPPTAPVATPPALTAPTATLGGPPTSISGIVDAVKAGSMSLKEAAQAMLQLRLGDSAIAKALDVNLGDLARLGVGAAALNQANKNTGGSSATLPSNAEDLMPGGGATGGGATGSMATGSGAFPTTVSGAAQDIVATADRVAQEQRALADAELGRIRPVSDAAVAAQQGIMAQQQAQAQSEYDYATAGQRPLIDQAARLASQDNTARNAAERQAVLDANNRLAEQTRALGVEQAGAMARNSDLFQGNVASERARYGLGVGNEIAAARSETQSALQSARDVVSRGLDTAYGTYYDSMARAADTIDAKESQLQAYLKAAQGMGDAISAVAGKYSGRINSDIDLYTSGDSAIRAKYGSDIESDAGLALADARKGQSAATAMAIRQAMRYGGNTGSIASQMALGSAAAQAAAANNARRDSTDRYRGLVGQGIGMRQNLMNSDVQAATAAGNLNMDGLRLGASSMLDGQRLALERAGLETSTINDIVGRDMDAGFRLSGMQSGAAIDLARMGIDSYGKQADMGMDAWSKLAGMNADAIATQYGAAGDANKIAAQAPALGRDMRIADDQRTMSNLASAAGLYDGAYSRAASAAGRVIDAANASTSNVMKPAEFALGARQYGDTASLTARQQAMGGLTSLMNANVNLATNRAGNSTALRGQNMDMWGTVGGFVLSDRRLKTDIRRVGTHPRGFGVYRYRYVTGGPERIGVMADEVQAIVPEAVGKVGRFLAVDYSRL